MTKRQDTDPDPMTARDENLAIPTVGCCVLSIKLDSDSDRMAMFVVCLLTVAIACLADRHLLCHLGLGRDGGGSRGGRGAGLLLEHLPELQALIGSCEGIMSVH